VKLVKSLKNALAWHFNQFAMFVGGARYALYLSVSALALSKTTQIISFFLPLKAILLAGSDSVPVYLEQLLDSSKQIWVAIILSVAFVFFLLSKLTQSWADNLISRGTELTLESNSRVILLSDQLLEPRQFFSRSCLLSADFIFALLMMMVIWFLNHYLFAIIGILLLVAFASTSMFFELLSEDKNLFLSYIADEYNQYLQFWSALMFFGGVVVIAWPLMFTDQGNIIFAVLAVITLRQVTGSLTSGISSFVKLYRARERVKLAFSPRTHPRFRDHVGENFIHDFMNKDYRVRLQKNLLSETGISSRDFDLVWQDSIKRTFFKFVLISQKGEKKFLIRVFTNKKRLLLAHERYLFGHIEREVIGAPAEVGSLTEKKRDIQVLEYNGREPLKTVNEESLMEIFQRCWEISVPKELAQSFSSANEILSNKLNDSLIELMSVAVKDEHGRGLFEKLSKHMPLIRQIIHQVPLFIYNPDINIENSFFDYDGTLRCHDWDNWSLEPLGGGDKRISDIQLLIDALPSIKAKREDVPESLTEEHLQLVADCQLLYRDLCRAAYERALHKTTVKIIENPLLN